MKKNVLKMFLFAIVVNILLTACEKDVNLTKNDATPVAPQVLNTWPEGALTTGNDTVWHETPGIERIDSLLCVYYDSNSINLPDGYCPIVSVQSGGDSILIRKGVVLLFEGRDRTTAINELKNVEDIYAIEPVYKTNDNNNLIVATPRIQIMLNNISDTSLMFNLTDSLRLHFEYSGNESSPIIVFYTNHSLVNSIAASNIIADCGESYIKGIIPNMAITTLRD